MSLAVNCSIVSDLLVVDIQVVGFRGVEVKPDVHPFSENFLDEKGSRTAYKVSIAEFQHDQRTNSAIPNGLVYLQEVLSVVVKAL